MEPSIKPISKALRKALFNHRENPKKYTKAAITKKFNLKQGNNFHRAMYYAVMLDAAEYRSRPDLF